ncbi:MAG: hypothetical protein HYR91_06185 [Flavobacteriia bacterium]|nr:hypothetical protein [Flavobacteriia bacterium]
MNHYTAVNTIKYYDISYPLPTKVHINIKFPANDMYRLLFYLEKEFGFDASNIIEIQEFEFIKSDGRTRMTFKLTRMYTGYDLKNYVKLYKHSRKAIVRKSLTL